jgi:5-dehydro-2-deoxygluconokinase
MDVWVLGRIGYDLYALDHNRALAEVEQFSRHLGGSSANIAVGLARLGFKVGIISAVGDDLLADYLFDFLRQENVDTHFVSRVRGANTSLCLTEVWPPDHFRQVFYRSNPADAQLSATPEALAQIAKARMFVTNGTSLAGSPSRESALAALSAARRAGVTTIFDVDYRASSWPSPAAAGEQARQALALADVVLANEEELAIVTGGAPDHKTAVIKAGVRILVEKLGARGVAAHTASESHFSSSRTANLVCAVGGGDGFAAGFLYALLRELELPTALDYGNAAAAIVVERVSCADCMPRLAELESRVKSSAATSA